MLVKHAGLLNLILMLSHRINIKEREPYLGDLVENRILELCLAYAHSHRFFQTLQYVKHHLVQHFYFNLNDFDFM